MELNKKSGFSLVEIMAVLAIIGILTVVAIPNGKIFMAKSRAAVAKSNLAGIMKNIVSYGIGLNGNLLALVDITAVSTLTYAVVPTNDAYTYTVKTAGTYTGQIILQADSVDGKVCGNASAHHIEMNQDESVIDNNGTASKDCLF